MGWISLVPDTLYTAAAPARVPTPNRDGRARAHLRDGDSRTRPRHCDRHRRPGHRHADRHGRRRLPAPCRPVAPRTAGTVIATISASPMAAAIASIALDLRVPQLPAVPPARPRCPRGYHAVDGRPGRHARRRVTERFSPRLRPSRDGSGADVARRGPASPAPIRRPGAHGMPGSSAPPTQTPSGHGRAHLRSGRPIAASH